MSFLNCSYNQLINRELEKTISCHFLYFLKNVSPFVSPFQNNIVPLQKKGDMKSKATARIILDTKHKDDEKKLLRIRITYRREPRLFSIGDDSIRLTQEQFNNPRLKKTIDAMSVANRALRIAEEVIAELGTSFTFDSFKKKYKQRLTGWDAESSPFDSLLSEYFKDPKHKCSYKTMKSYKTSVNWVMRYRKKATPSSITSDFVDNLILFMQKEHLKEHDSEMSENTKRMYLRQLRAIYNFAIEKGFTNNKNPFAKRQLSSSKRTKAALSKEEMKMLRDYQPKDKSEEMGKDFFFLTFHCNGANLGDILLFKNSYIEDGTLSFVRRKTQQKNSEPIQIKLSSAAIALFNKYGKISTENPDSLILPYLSNATSEKNRENIIKREIRKVNAGLKSICDSLGWRKITTYNARHTFATILRDEGMSIEKIQKLLGHSSILTTQNYLGSLSTEILDKTKSILEEFEIEE